MKYLRPISLYRNGIFRCQISLFVLAPLNWLLFLHIFFLDFFRKSCSSIEENQDWKPIDFDWWNRQNGTRMARGSNSGIAWNAWSWTKQHISWSLPRCAHWLVKSSISLHCKYPGYYPWTFERSYGNHWYFRWVQNKKKNRFKVFMKRSYFDSKLAVGRIFRNPFHSEGWKNKLRRFSVKPRKVATNYAIFWDHKDLLAL